MSAAPNAYCCHCFAIYPRAERHECIGSLREENRKLRSMCKAAAAEIEAHWEAHCDKAGYGPVNLVSRLSEKTKPDLYPDFDA